VITRSWRRLLPSLTIRKNQEDTTMTHTTTHKTASSKMTACTAAVAALLGFGAPAAHAHGNVDAEFKKMDTNNDGKISADEFAAAAQARFRKADTNNDGKVSLTEMQAMAEEHDKGKGVEKADTMAAERFKKMDTNNDGVVSADENAAGAKMWFDKMDTDHDGYLTKTELRAGHEKMMEKAGKS
jgi:Ca2+-binding EF-hand superfamily protein